jgi:hypothetical protein
MEENKSITTEELEAARLEVLRLGGPHKKRASLYFWLAVACFFALIVAVIVLTSGETYAEDIDVWIWITLGALSVGLVAFFILQAKHQAEYMKYLNPYNALYKTQFLPGIIRDSFDSVYTFEPQNGLSREIVIKSGIFPTFDYIATNDYLRASHCGLNFEYCDMQLQEKHTERDSDGDTRTVIDTVFLGVFIIAEFDHFVNTPVYITAGGGKGTVTTESEIFNRSFSIKCENDVDALRILTPDMMDHILGIKELCKKDISIAFLDDKIFFGADLGGDRLEIAGTIDIPISESRLKVDADIRFIKELLELLHLRNLKSKSSQRVRTDADFAGNAVYQNEQR